MKPSILRASLLIVPLAVWSTGAARATECQPVSREQVKVGGEIGRRIDITVQKNLLALEVDRQFLEPFVRKNVTTDLTARCLGHLVEATVGLATYSRDEKVVALKKHLIERITSAQEPDGYIGFFTPPLRMTGIWDLHEIGYLIEALVSDSTQFKEASSLASARKAADYVIRRWPDIPADWEQRTMFYTWVAAAGLQRSMLALYQATGDPRYLQFVTRQLALAEWNSPIVIGRQPGSGGHVASYLIQCVGQLDLHDIQPDPRLLRASDRAVEFETHGDGMTIGGGAGWKESWNDDQEGMGPAHAETCATAYELRVWERLLRLRGDAKYGDLMERAIYNTLFAAQSPDGRRIRYFTPTSGERVYVGDVGCCPSNYRRILGELPTMIYYRWQSGVAVNLYTTSEARMEVASGTPLTIRQTTRYPSDGVIVVNLDPATPARFPLRLRVPAWAAKATIRVNGSPFGGAAAPGSFVAIDRLWKAGDEVRLEMPMEFRLIRGRKRESGRVAVARGPVVFCLNPAQQQELEGLHPIDLGRYTLDPKSFELIKDDSIRPDGVACRVGAWRVSYYRGPVHDLKLVLTEFPDPGGRAVYFKLRDMAPSVGDELLDSEAGVRRN